MQSAFKDLGIKSPALESLKVQLSCAFHKAAKKKKIQFTNPKSFRVANDGPGRRSIDSLVDIIESEGLEVEFIVRVK